MGPTGICLIWWIVGSNSNISNSNPIWIWRRTSQLSNLPEITELLTKLFGQFYQAMIYFCQKGLRFKIFGFDSTLVHNSREIKIGLLLLVAAANIFSFVFLGCWHLHGSGLWQHLVRKLESGDPFESSHVLSTQFLPDLNHRLQRIPCYTL